MRKTGTVPFVCFRCGLSRFSHRRDAAISRFPRPARFAVTSGPTPDKLRSPLLLPTESSSAERYVQLRPEAVEVILPKLLEELVEVLRRDEIELI